MSSRSEDQFKLLVHAGELDRLASWVLERPRIETGGNLFGFWTHSGAPTVQFVLGPGDHARHENTAFYQDREHLTRVGTDGQTRHGLQHIGDWHSHHRIGLREPSGGDARTALKVFDDTDFTSFMLMIANIVDERAKHVEIGAFLFERGRKQYRIGQWVVLPGESPVGESMHQKTKAPKRSRTKATWSVPTTTLPAGVPSHPKEGWYTEEWGTELLRALDAWCRTRFVDCRMSLSDSSGLLYRLRAPRGDVELRFPTAYPEEDAVITVSAGGREQAYRVPPEVITADQLFATLLAVADPHQGNRKQEPRNEEARDGVESGTAVQAAMGTAEPARVLPGPGVAPPDGPDQDGGGGPVPD